MKFVNYSKRGMQFETMINDTNLYYAKHNLAIVHKKSTPIKVLRVENNKITNAIYLEKSTTDYNGIYKGKYIDFEAKTTSFNYFDQKTNLKNHQVNHLKQIDEQGGIGFFIVFFKKHKKIFIIDIQQLALITTSKIDIKYFIDNCFEIKISINPIVDYLKYIDFKMEENV